MQREPHVQPESTEDAAAIDRVHSEAFGGEAEVGLVRALRAGTAFEPSLSLVARVGETVVGHVLLHPVEVRGDDGALPALALAPLAVRPAWQRRGIGTALVHVALDAARAAGHRCVLVLGDPAYYGRFGFAPATDTALVPPDATWVPHYQALALDEGPLPSGRVDYPAAFDGV